MDQAASRVTHITQNAIAVVFSVLMIMTTGCASTGPVASTAPPMKMTTDIPASIKRWNCVIVML